MNARHDPALRRAIEIVGSQTELAIRLTKIGPRVTRNAICQWSRAPIHRVLAIEKVTDGAVTRYELRPDIYGEAPETETTAA